ncbi:MAG TPA: hypothetical protein VHW01_11075 [Polyangiaceae bacterium]|nr:hypothetical protein [Polyangiaceae bacterium]
MKRLVVALPVLALLLGAPRSATARERAFSLSWDTPEECPDRATVERYVDDVLGAADFGPLAVRASGAVSRTADARYAVALELDTGAAQRSRRSLDAANCEAVSRAAALLIALAIRARVAPPPAPPPAPAPALPPPVPEPAPTREHHVRGFIGLLTLADFGAIPEATLGVGVSGGVRWPRLQLESAVGYFSPRSASAASRSDVGARFELGTAGARACPPITVTALWLAPCLGAGVDWVRAPGFGARVTHRPSTWDLIARFGLLGGWDISSIISAHAEVEGVLPLARPEYEIDGVGDVYRRSPVGVRTGLGVQLQF